MPLSANNPDRISWLHVDKNSDFPIQNIPFGVFLTRDDIITIGTRIGDTAIDLGALHQLGYFDGIPLTDDIFLQDTLNDFIAGGRKTWRAVRNRIAQIFDANNDTLKNNTKHKETILFRLDEIEMQLPVQIGDYTPIFTQVKNMQPMLVPCLETQKMHYSQIGCTLLLVIMVEVLPLFRLEFLCTDLKVKPYQMELQNLFSDQVN